jgi:acyl-CoA synthetase (AMP-forming)/AMP-acid ligase II
MNFSLFLEMHARGRPEALALVDRQLRLTYAELNEAASRFANLLAARGLGARDRVAFYLPNRAEMAIGLLGAFKAGVIAVPLNWRLTAADLARPVGHAAPAVMVTTEELKANLPDMGSALVLTCGNGERQGTFWDALAEADAVFESVGCQSDDIANLLYTSGTTSMPKAVIHTHGMRVAMAATMASCFHLSCRDVGIAVSPMFHTGGLSVFANAIFCGGAVVLQERWDLDEFLDAIAREGVTFMHLVATIVVDIVRAPAARFENHPKTVRFVWGGGHSADPSLFEEFERRLGGTFSQGYSRTEGGITYNPLDRTVRAFDMHGYPNRNNSEIAILDRDTGIPCPPGKAGEIAFHGDGVTPGYWDNDRISVIRPRAGIWQPTGDAGLLREDGALVFLGREDHLIKTGGENVYPSEITSVLLAMPEVSDAVVFDMPDERLGQTVSALVVPKRAGLTKEEVVVQCRSKLAGFKIPRRLALVDSLPRLGSQKVDLAECRRVLIRLEDARS